jgi:two-component sensor histidine kinase
MALAHENLYHSGNLAEVDFAEHLRNLTTSLLRSYGRSGISCTVDATEVKFGIDVAIPCGLIITELISNALKHAFPLRDAGTIAVSVHIIAPGRARLTVRDDGIGFPAQLDWRESASMGWTLINMLTDQLGGTVAVTRDNGTTITVDFPTVLAR